MEILFSTFLQSLKKQTTEHSYKEWSNVDILNDKILKWNICIFWGFFGISSLFKEYNSINDKYKQQHGLRYVFKFWISSLILEERLVFRLIAKINRKIRQVVRTLT